MHREDQKKIVRDNGQTKKKDMENDYRQATERQNKQNGQRTEGKEQTDRTDF